MTAAAPTARTRMKRRTERARYAQPEIRRILDESFIAHVGVSLDGQPFVLPMVYAVSGDHLVLHGSQGSRLMRALRDGAEVCVTVTLLDGLVLARSAFHTSVNYRCVMLFGRAEEVDDPDEKWAAMRHVVEHAAPGRWNDVRHPDESEIRQTMVLRIPLDEASAKVRDGGPIEEESDYALSCWAGVLPLSLSPGEPVDDPLRAPGAAAPAYVTAYTRPRSVEPEA